MINECPICERVGLEPCVYDCKFALYPRSITETTEFLVEGLVGLKCNSCGNICEGPHQIRHNEELIRHERRRLYKSLGIKFHEPETHVGRRVEKI